MMQVGTQQMRELCWGHGGAVHLVLFLEVSAERGCGTRRVRGLSAAAMTAGEGLGIADVADVEPCESWRRPQLATLVHRELRGSITSCSGTLEWSMGVLMYVWILAVPQSGDADGVVLQQQCTVSGTLVISARAQLDLLASSS